MSDAGIAPRRGRPRKQRPTDLRECKSQRDLAAAAGISRKLLAQALLIASIPDEEFEAIVESDEPGDPLRKLELLARRRAGKVTEYVRRCPHCGHPLRIEEAS
jgi:hypothetical protein